MQLVEILTEIKLSAQPLSALSLRANPENRAAQPGVGQADWPRTKAEQETAENQKNQVPNHHANSQAPELLRSGVLAFAPPFQEVTH